MDLNSNLKNHDYGVIYKIIHEKTGFFYIGSSFNFDYRIKNHKRDYNANKKSFFYNKLRENNICFDECIIEKLKTLSNVNNIQLRYEENIFIKKYKNDEKNCNKILWFRNKKDTQEYFIEYREKNYEKLTKNFTCYICNGKYTYEHISHHTKSFKHQKELNYLLNIQI